MNYNDSSKNQVDGGLCILENLEDFEIRALDESSEKDVIHLINKNLSSFEDDARDFHETSLLIESILKNYKRYGSCFYIVKDVVTKEIVGGAGLCPLASLPLEEGIGEIRGLVLDEQCTGQGIGTALMKLCLEKAKKFGYKKIYLKTTPQMEYAHSLFQRFGFKPIIHLSDKKEQRDSFKIPYYFVLENLQ